MKGSINTLWLSDCPIFLGDFESAFSSWIATQSYSAVFRIADTNTNTLLPPTDSGIAIPAGETHKNLDTCRNVWSAMLDAGLDRRALALNLGGGVVGDLGGFCAATYKRGIDFVQAPTTLLAMTDAAIGGKVGVDFLDLKNMIGVFRQPAAVFVDPAFLRTLPARELRSGMAEVYKHALIGDPTLWTQLQRDGAALLDNSDAPEWLELLKRSIKVKLRVVETDPFEKNLRAVLNFGHTIGHAVESWSLQTPTPLLHGEAVVFGLLTETRLQHPALAEALAAELLPLFGKVELPESAWPEIWALMQHDKKNADGAVYLALPGNEPFQMERRSIREAELYRALAWYAGVER